MAHNIVNIHMQNLVADYSCLCWCKFLLQGDPDVTNEAVPVVPNCDKLDLERFYQDLPKYMPYLSASARDNWQQFKTANPSSLTTDYSLKWELPILHTAAILSATDVQDVDHHVSSETSALLQKEVATPKEVHSVWMHN